MAPWASKYIMPVAPKLQPVRRSLDTEVTGLDIYWKGQVGSPARPFFVTGYDEQTQNNTFWHWEVDPVTRRVLAVKEDLVEIQDYINQADQLILQNAKFDHAALRESFKENELELQWDWDKVHDTLLSAHLIASNQPKDLTTQALKYLNSNILPVENTLRIAVLEARKIIQRKANSNLFGNWMIAKKGVPCMPSVKGGKEDKFWAADMWIPRTLVLWCLTNKRFDIVPNGTSIETLANHHWLQALPEYSNTDSTVTMFIHKKHMEIIASRGYMKVYNERPKVLEPAAKMEEVGLVLSKHRLHAQRGKYRGESAVAYKRLRSIANRKNYDLELPKSGRNKSLDHFLFGYDQYSCPECKYEYREVKKPTEGKALSVLCPKCEAKAKKKGDISLVPSLNKITVNTLNLPVVKTSQKTGAPSADAKVLEHYEATLPPGEELDFVRVLRGKRSRDTAVSYLDSYERFWVPDERYLEEDGSDPTWYRLHPSFNAVGTDTLRWSSKNPNGTNISKKEKFNLRMCFGPGPGREWFSMDGKNLELRIAAYGADEKGMIELFERPKDPPFYGSNHLLSFSVVYPDIWNDALTNKYWEWEGEYHGKKIDINLVGPYCKEKYADSYYQWCKNGNFAKQYGGQQAKVDATFHCRGAFHLLESRFSKIAAFNKKCVAAARLRGFIETLPDKTVDPLHGYPLLCRGGRKRPGEGVSPTLPFNYWSQGSACWWISKAIVRTGNYLKEHNRGKPKEQQASLVMYLHDELAFDLPKSELDPRTVIPETIGYRKTNLPIVSKLNALMALGGKDIGIPTPVSCKYHPENWSEGFSVKLNV